MISKYNIKKVMNILKNKLFQINKILLVIWFYIKLRTFNKYIKRTKYKNYNKSFNN